MLNETEHIGKKTSNQLYVVSLPGLKLSFTSLQGGVQRERKL